MHLFPEAVVAHAHGVDVAQLGQGEGVPGAVVAEDAATGPENKGKGKEKELMSTFWDSSSLQNVRRQLFHCVCKLIEK